MRLGLWMCFGYAVFYAGFVAINLISPKAMEAEALLGMNLATIYGFALIVVALIAALFYNVFCAREERRLGGSNDDKGRVKA